MTLSLVDGLARHDSWRGAQAGRKPAPVLGSHEQVVYLLPGHTPTGLHEATDVVIDFVFDEADTEAHANGLRQVWLEMARLPVEPGIQSAAPNIESGRSFADGDDP